MEEYKPLSYTTSKKLKKVITDWQRHLLSERRLADKTGESYLRDLKEFFHFFTE